MRFLVRQRLPEGGEVMQDHVLPMAGVVAGSMEDPPRGPVVWLGGCGNIETSEYYMLFDAPDQETIDECVRVLPGLIACERVMSVDRKTIGYRLLQSMAATYDGPRDPAGDTTAG